MKEKECVPFAPSLIESMRFLGYSFPSAIADLLDNSISADAKNINIISEPAVDPSLIILDDGYGMSEKECYEAMRYGCNNPLNKRDASDLGRFGLGMKSASLSQCRELIVISKHRGKICGYSWNLDFVIRKKAWNLLVLQNDEIDELPHIEELKKLKHGTFLLLRNFDRIKENTSNISETFNNCLVEMSKHLALVFHRFIAEGLNIYVNKNRIEGRDPFLSNHKATQKKRTTSIFIDEKEIKLTPYILPHLSKLNQDDLDKIGGKENLRREQGFYVYRNKRLIIWGTWFRLIGKDELNKLARVEVDIPNTLDYLWSIDIKKSTATLPDIIKKNMYSAVYESVAASERVHTYRGRKEKSDNDIDYVWEKKERKSRDGYEYLINRNIPQMAMLEETMDSQQVKMLSTLLTTLEKTFPVGAFYVDAAKGKIETDEKNDNVIEEVWDELKEQIDYIKEHNLSEKKYYESFLTVEPYCNYEEIKKRIREEISKL
jgi:hypothetical protein